MQLAHLAYFANLLTKVEESLACHMEFKAKYIV